MGLHSDESISASMEVALTAATKAWRDHRDVPVGAVLLDAAGEIISIGVNERELTQDPTAHAEIVAIRKGAMSLKSWRLEGCSLLVTMAYTPSLKDS